MKVALVCIAKNEDNYIEEWINFHTKLGFDKIFIYENNWRCNINHDNVIKIRFDGNVQQLNAYNHFIKKFTGEYDWVAFFDVDEFLVLKKHNNIHEFLSVYNDHHSVCINWVLFGDNHISEINNNDYSVIKRFTKRQLGTNQHIKIITKLFNGLHMNVHHSNLYSVDTNMNKINGPFNPNGPDDTAQLNHYFCKTKQEFALKVARGRADVSSLRSMSEFDNHNFNDLEDLLAYNFMYANLS